MAVETTVVSGSSEEHFSTLATTSSPPKLKGICKIRRYAAKVVHISSVSHGISVERTENSSNRSLSRSLSPGVGAEEQAQPKVNEEERCRGVVRALDFAAPVRGGAPAPPAVLTGERGGRDEQEAAAAAASSISEAPARVREAVS